MNAEPKEASDQNNSGNENDDDKSEEFLNFERGLKGILAIPPEEVKEIIRKTPYPRYGEENQDEEENN